MLLPKLLMASAAIGTPIAMSNTHTPQTLGAFDLIMTSSKPLGSDEVVHSATYTASGYGTDGSNYLDYFVPWKDQTTHTAGGATPSSRRIQLMEQSTFTVNSNNNEILSMNPFSGSGMWKKPTVSNINTVPGVGFTIFDQNFSLKRYNKINAMKDGAPVGMASTGTAYSDSKNSFFSIVRFGRGIPTTSNFDFINADGTTYDLTWDQPWTPIARDFARLSAMVEFDSTTLKPINHKWLNAGAGGIENYAYPTAFSVNPTNGDVSIMFGGHVFGGLAGATIINTSHTCDFTNSTPKQFVFTKDLNTIKDCKQRTYNGVTGGQWYDYPTKIIEKSGRTYSVGVTGYHGSDTDASTADGRLKDHFVNRYDGKPNTHAMSVPYFIYGNTGNFATINGSLWGYGHNNYATGTTNEGQSTITDFEDIILSKDGKWFYALMSSGTAPTAEAGAPAEMKAHQGGVDMYVMKYKVQDLETGNLTYPEAVINIGGSGNDYGRGLLIEESTQDLLVYGDVKSGDGDFDGIFESKNTLKFDTAIVRIETNNTRFEVAQVSGIQTASNSVFPNFVSTRQGTFFSLYTEDASLQDGVPNPNGLGGDVVLGQVVSVLETEKKSRLNGELNGYNVHEILPRWRIRPNNSAKFGGYEDIDRDGTLDSYKDYLIWKSTELFNAATARTAVAYGIPVEEVRNNATTIQELESFITTKNSETGESFKLPAVTEEDHKEIEAGFDVVNQNWLSSFISDNMTILLFGGAFATLYIALLLMNKRNKEEEPGRE